MVGPGSQAELPLEERHAYGADFYRANVSIAVRSAQRIIPKVIAALPARSVVDFGCGPGAWLSVWAAAGASVTGVDGPFVDREELLIDPTRFHRADLAKPIELETDFELVQSLEVAEHLPAASAEGFVESLVAHGPRVLFSAATPGQGGEHHVNEQPLEYWRAIFRRRGFIAIDFLRPLIAKDNLIEPWYRYNILLYVREDTIAALPQWVRSCCVPDGQPLRDYRPQLYRLRTALVRRLPLAAVDQLSRLKWRLAPPRTKRAPLIRPARSPGW
jgi:SAM-dependent methyltransferase